MMTPANIGPALTWNELADLYDKATGRRARIRPMDDVFAWAEKQPEKFFVDQAEGTLHLVRKGKVQG